MVLLASGASETTPGAATTGLMELTGGKLLAGAGASVGARGLSIGGEVKLDTAVRCADIACWFCCCHRRISVTASRGTDAASCLLSAVSFIADMSPLRALFQGAYSKLARGLGRMVPEETELAATPPLPLLHGYRCARSRRPNCICIPSWVVVG